MTDKSKDSDSKDTIVIRRVIKSDQNLISEATYSSKVPYRKIAKFSSSSNSIYHFSFEMLSLVMCFD